MSQALKKPCSGEGKIRSANESANPEIFNAAGVCEPSRRCVIPVLPRVPGMGEMIEGRLHLTLRAPRQSGKATFLQSLPNKINYDRKYYIFNWSLSALKDVKNIDNGDDRHRDR